MSPKVSVVMITYGHEKYIQQAMEGVFLQKTNFPVELIIANDNSPDHSDEVIHQTIQNAPENVRVKYTKHSENKGMMGNHHWALGQAGGKYTAICDGDDFWIDENKLQIQADFLDQNPDYAIHCHNFKTQTGDAVSADSHFDQLTIKESMDITDLSANNIIPTLTAMFRTEKVDFPAWTAESPLGDLVLFLNIARKGKIKFLNEKMAVYRRNVGVWSGKKIDHLAMLKMYGNLASDFSDLPPVSANLLKNQKKHTKAYLKELPLSEMLKHSYFRNLSMSDKLKLSLKQLI